MIDDERGRRAEWRLAKTPVGDRAGRQEERSERIINDNHRRQMEQVLGHSFTAEELQPADTLSALSMRLRDAAGQLLQRSRPLDVMFLQELVPGTDMNDANSFLDDVFEGGEDARLWKQSRWHATT